MTHGNDCSCPVCFGRDGRGYPHSMHPRYVSGCPECLERTKAAQRRFTESRRRLRQRDAAIRLGLERGD